MHKLQWEKSSKYNVIYRERKEWAGKELADLQIHKIFIRSFN